MKTFIDGYKKKVINLLRLCLEARDYGFSIGLDYSAINNEVEIFHYDGDKIIKFFSIYLDFQDHDDILHKATEYIQNLIVGDTHVHTR